MQRKSPKNFETVTNGTEIYRESCQKIRIFQPKISETPGGNQKEWKFSVIKFPKISVSIARLSSFPEIAEKAGGFIHH